jgi:hypothetical protein
MIFRCVGCLAFSRLPFPFFCLGASNGYSTPFLKLSRKSSYFHWVGHEHSHHPLSGNLG